MSPTSSPEKEDSTEYLRSREDVENPDSKDNKAKGDDSDPRDTNDLYNAEKSATGNSHENTLGGGYKPSITAGGKFRFTKKKAAIGGGGVVGIIIGLAFMFSLTGPFQFIHFAQLLQQFHFNSLEDQTDVRAFRMIRFIKSGGDVREARVGTVASRLAHRMEARFNTAGFKYIDIGPQKHFGGFQIDRNNENFRGRSDADIRAELDRGGIRTEIRNGQIVAPAVESYRQNRLLTESIMRRVGYWKISSPIQSRAVAAKWFGFTRWHPMRKADAKINQAIAPYWEDFKRRFNERVGKGEYGVSALDGAERRAIIPDCEPDCTPEEQAEIDRQNEEARRYNEDIDRQVREYQDRARDLQEEGRRVNAEDQRERGDHTRELARSLRSRLIGGTAMSAASATALLCTVDGMNDQYEALKQDRIIYPLIRLAMEMVSVGNQVMDGEDADLDQLGAYDQLFDDPATGSWLNSPDFKAELGEEHDGQLTDDQVSQKQNLDHIGESSPFASIVDTADTGLRNLTGFSVNELCSTVGQIVSTVFTVAASILTGGGVSVASFLLSGALQAVATEVAMHLFASMMAGTAVDPYAEGAIMGTNANYGARLAASEMNVARGGKELSEQEAREVDDISRADIDRRFASQSVAHRLFDPYDPRSTFAKLVDKTDPEISGNIAKISHSVFNVQKMFASIPSLFGSTTNAAPALPYDYGFSEFGFAASDMDNDATYNPYDNARASVQLLTGGSGPTLMERAKHCFGVNIAQSPVTDVDGNQQQAWGVTHVGTEDAPQPYNETNDEEYNDWDCAGSDTEWLRIRMFIYDTTTMDAMSCFEEDDQESCDRVGFSPPAPPPTSGPGGGSGGECDRDTWFPGYEEGGYTSDTEYMAAHNPPPSGEGSNYGNGAAPVKFPGACRGPGSDDAHDLSYTRNTGGGNYQDSAGQNYDDRGLKR